MLIPSEADRETRDRLIQGREAACARVRTELASARTRPLMIDLAEWLALGDWRMRPADAILLRSNVEDFACELLEAHRKQLRRRGAGLATLEDAERHKVRIAAKKLRYATGFFGALHREKNARRYKAFLGALEDPQDRLGALNDLAIRPAVLAKLGIGDKPPEAGERADLLDRAENAFRAWKATERFW